MVFLSSIKIVGLIFDHKLKSSLVLFNLLKKKDTDHKNKNKKSTSKNHLKY